jgi:hypothetical protein
MTGAVMLIADYIYSPALTIVAGLLSVLLFALLWALLPVWTRPERASN